MKKLFAVSVLVVSSLAFTGLDMYHYFTHKTIISSIQIEGAQQKSYRRTVNRSDGYPSKMITAPYIPAY